MVVVLMDQAPGGATVPTQGTRGGSPRSVFMTKYVDKSLAADETVVLRGRWPVAHWVGAYAALFLLGPFIIGIVIYLNALIRMLTTEFAVTDRRVILKSGFMHRTTREIAVESIEAVSLHQSFWGGLFGYGRVMVTGSGETHIFFPPMARPVDFRRAIEDARAAAHKPAPVNVVHVEAPAVAANDTQPSPNTKPKTKPARSVRFVGLFRS